MPPVRDLSSCLFPAPQSWFFLPGRYRKTDQFRSNMRCRLRSGSGQDRKKPPRRANEIIVVIGVVAAQHFRPATKPILQYKEKGTRTRHQVNEEEKNKKSFTSQKPQGVSSAHGGWFCGLHLIHHISLVAISGISRCRTLVWALTLNAPRLTASYMRFASETAGVGLAWPFRQGKRKRSFRL